MLSWLIKLFGNEETKGIHETKSVFVATNETIGRPPKRQPTKATLEQRRQGKARRKNRDD